MTDDEIDVAWSQSVAVFVADELVMAGLLSKAVFERAKAIIAEEVYVRLAAKDRPDRTNWRFQSK